MRSRYAHAVADSQFRLLMAVLATALATLTLIVPQWIEAKYRGGTGRRRRVPVEWFVAAVFAVIAVLLMPGAWRIYRRPSGPAQAAP